MNLDFAMHMEPLIALIKENRRLRNDLSRMQEEINAFSFLRKSKKRSKEATICK